MLTYTYQRRHHPSMAIKVEPHKSIYKGSIKYINPLSFSSSMQMLRKRNPGKNARQVL
jgi:hypothetical protein